MIAPADASARLHAGGEIAFLDVREAGPFSEGHPLFAVPAPYSRLELDVARLVPRRDTPVLLIDGGDGIAARAARALARLGYGDAGIVEGGAPGWQAAGLTLFKGVNVPSKTLGELAEAVWHPATLEPATLAAWRREGRSVQLFDVRPPAEHARMRVPGARCLPNGELAHRFDAAVTGEGPVVVTCAGRTRGLIGALGLGLAGIGAPVFALANGTQGWALAGEALERGNTPDPFPPLEGAAAQATRRRAETFLARHKIAVLDAAAVQAWCAEPGRTTYLFDVRSAEEAAADPLPAFVHAPSGQLVQATDQWAAVRRARMVLADDLGLRGGLAAYWLRALGFEVAVARVDAPLRRLLPRACDGASPLAPTVSATAALEAVGRGVAAFVDVRPSTAYRAGHVAGSRWGSRARPPSVSAAAVHVIGDDAAVAQLYAGEVRERFATEAMVVEGGHAALVAAGAALESTPHEPAPAEAVDITWFAHGRHDGDLAVSRLYLEWEQGLVGQLSPAERAEFRLG